LSDEECERADRYLDPVDRHRYVHVRTWLRLVLAGYLEVHPRQIEFGRRRCPRCGSDVHGAPVVSAPRTPLTFNVSRSGTHALVAITVGKQVGVDIECAREVDVDALGGDVLTTLESRYLSRLRPAARQAAFFRCWTRKEAVSKASGHGIAFGMNRLDVHPEQRFAVDVDCLATGSSRKWRVSDLSVVASCFAAVAQPRAGAGPVIVCPVSV
jgi:4'-phosphopantetheinyl transferase